MKQLAVCIPTYNSPDMIQEMFIRCLDIYREFGIDIFVFDSSSNCDTETIVLQYTEKYNNIIYRHLPPDIHSNIKVLEAYKEIIGMEKYAYLWLCPDYIQLTRQGVECVLKHCLENFDICILNYRDVEQIGEKVYTDINDFFLDCAWHMSSYMATVIRLSSFSDLDWEKFYERYTIPRRINHSHVALYFEQLAKLPQIKAVHIPVTSAQIRVSSYRKASFWKKDVFPIWCEYWPDTIRALPDQYHNKKEVIKKLGVNTGIFGWNHLKSLRKENIYDKKVYRKYRREWKDFTNVPIPVLGLLAMLPAQMTVLLPPYSLKRSLMNRRIRCFCAGCENIWIYGCGFMAEKTSNLLDELHISYQGYVVSDASNEKKTFHGLPVIEYQGLLSKNSHIGVMIALNEGNTLQVMKEKRELAFYKTFYMYPYEDVL